mgnify:FL=1
MSLENVQYRSVIRFLLMKGKSREEIFVELSSVYGEESPSISTVKRWFNYFRDGRTSVFDEEKSGRSLEIGEEIAKKLTKIMQCER